MPIATNSVKAPVRNPGGRPRKPVAATFQEPLPAIPAEPKAPSGPPSDHNGVVVVREELLHNLPSGSPFKISKLHLADESVAWCCRDCWHSFDSRLLAQRHRNETHGARYGKKPPKVLYETSKEQHPLDLVQQPRADGNPPPSNPMEWTLAELLALVPSLDAVNDLIELRESERDTAVAELTEREKHDRENRHKIDVYDSLQSEVVELRVAMKNTGSYEQLKAEVIELRAWKKKMVAKLSVLGFKLEEEQ